MDIVCCLSNVVLCSFCPLVQSKRGNPDIQLLCDEPIDGRTDRPTDGHGLLNRCENASTNMINNDLTSDEQVATVDVPRGAYSF